jgi:hypothetical protein
MADTPAENPVGSQLKVRVTRLGDGETYIPTGDVVAYLRAMAVDAPNWAEVDENAPGAVHNLVEQTLGMCELGILRHADRLDCMVMMMLSRPPDFVIEDDSRSRVQVVLSSYAVFVAALVGGNLAIATVNAVAHDLWSGVFTYVVLGASLVANVLAIHALRRSNQEAKRVTAECERITKIIEMDRDGPPPHFT